MQVCEKLGNLGNQPAKNERINGYWAKRFPRSFAKNPEAFIKKEDIKKPEPIIQVTRGVTGNGRKKIVINPRKKPPPPTPEEIRAKEQFRQEQLAKIEETLKVPKRKSVQDIVLILSYITDVPPLLITGRSRRREVSMARAAVCITARTLGYTTVHIAKCLDGRDHSTVSHFCTESLHNPNVIDLVNKAASIIAEETAGVLA